MNIETEKFKHREHAKQVWIGVGQRLPSKSAQAWVCILKAFRRKPMKTHSIEIMYYVTVAVTRFSFVWGERQSEMMARKKPFKPLKPTSRSLLNVRNLFLPMKFSMFSAFAFGCKSLNSPQSSHCILISFSPFSSLSSSSSLLLLVFFFFFLPLTNTLFHSELMIRTNYKLNTFITILPMNQAINL